MSVAPDTPDDWRTITVNGVKMDIAPNATAAEVIEHARTRQLENKHTKHKRAWKPVNAQSHGLVREADVGTDEEGWLSPESPADYAEFDLSDVEDGNVLKVHAAKADWTPVYPEEDDDT
jgi:hypothetical protein